MRLRPIPFSGRLLPATATIVLALVALWLLGLPATSPTAAAPVRQDATATPEPTPLWPQRTLYGGPIYDLAVGPNSAPDATDTQRIWAVGNGVFHAPRGITWTRSARDLPDAVSVLAASAEVAFVSDREGDGHRTTNGGRGWSPTRLSVEGRFRFAATSPDFEREEQVYAIGEQDGRLWRSSDKGLRWSEVILERGAQLQSGAVGFSPLFGSDETVFVGSNEGFHESTDGGLSWSEARGADAGGPTFGPEVGPLAYQGIWVATEFGDDPLRAVDPDVQDIFAWTPAGLWRSDDRGASWQRIALPTTLEALHDVAISPGWPEDPVIAIAGAGAGQSGPLGAVSEDGGRTWREIAGSPGLTGTSIALAADFWHIRGPDQTPPRRSPQLTEFIFLPGVYRSFDFTGDPNASPPVPPDYAPPSPIVLRREIYLGTDGAGVWISEDLGRSWTPSQESLRNVQPSALTFLDEESLLAGSVAAGLFRSTDGGDSWQAADSNLPRGASSSILALAASPEFARDRTVLAVTETGLWRSTDAGASWTATNGPAGAPALAYSPSFAQDRTVIAGGARSTDGGATWAPMAGLEGTRLLAATFSPRYAQDSTLWAGGVLADDPDTGTGLRISTDGGDSWSTVEDRGMREREVVAMTAMAVDPAEDIRLLVGTTNGLMSSTDGGETFRRVSGLGSRGATGLVSTVLRDPFVTGYVFAATSEGIYWSRNRGIDYEREPRSPKPTLRIALSPGIQRIAATMPDGLIFADLAAIFEPGE